MQLSTDDDTDPALMLNQLEQAFGYPPDLLLNELERLRKTVWTQLEADGSSALQPFGTLRWDGHQLQFDQSAQNLLQDVYGAEALSLVPAEKSFRPEPVIPVPNISRQKERNLKPLWITLGILWLIFLALLFWPEQKPTATTAETTTEQDSSDLLNHDDSLVLGILPAPDTNIAVDSNISPPDTVLVDHQVGETIIQQANMDSLSKELTHKDCIIIIGSFLKAGNADRLASKVSENHFEVYRGSYKDFHRVGIRFDCMQHDLRSLLDSLKKQFHPHAWVLKMPAQQ